MYNQKAVWETAPTVFDQESLNLGKTIIYSFFQTD